MSVGGAGAHGARIAAATALVVLLLIPTIPLPTAEAQAATDPWWGPSNRDRPTEGWAVRFPLIVENTFDYPLLRPLAWVDVDLGKLLVQAGWTSQTVGVEKRLRGFTLDVDSIRVVEYGRGFSPGPIDGSNTKPVPHTFYTSPFDGARFREFDPARNPVGTLLFQIPGNMAPADKRFFYVYANPLEYADTPPAQWKLEERGNVDSFLWGTSGNTVMGYTPNVVGSTHGLQILATSGARQTTVTFYEFSIGKFVPVPSTDAAPNPRILGQGGATTYIPTGGRAWKIVADRPIQVQSHGTATPVSGSAGGGGTPTSGYNNEETCAFYPSDSGSFAGRSFWVWGFRNSNNQGAIEVVKSGPGNINVFLNNGPVIEQLSEGKKTGGFNIPSSTSGLNALGWNRITATGDILVAGACRLDTPWPARTIPALTGGPSGTSFFTAMPVDGGYLMVCPEARSSIRIVERDRSSFQIHPEGLVDDTSPLMASKRDGCNLVEATPTTPQAGQFTLEAYAVNEDKYPVDGAPVPFRIVTGASGRYTSTLERSPVGHWGGLGATDFYVTGPVGFLAYFNDTRITVFDEKKDGTYTNRSISVPGYYPLPEPTNAHEYTGRKHIVSAKPVSVVSIGPASKWAYAVPGLPQTPKVTLGNAEFRGPLIELRSPDTDGRQLFRSTGPGTPISFRLEAINLGQWIADGNLPDTIHVSCEGPRDWTLSGCERDFQLGSGQGERFDVVVTPSLDDVNTTAFVTVKATSRTEGITSEFRLAVYVEIRYGVNLWFDLGNGVRAKTIDPPFSMDPGRTERFDIDVENSGSAVDDFDITVGPPKEGWKQRLLYQGEPVSTLRLSPGEVADLVLEVTAPDAESAPQNLVPIRAESRSSDLAAAKDLVNFASRIRPKVSIALEVDPLAQQTAPGVPAEFNVTVRNSGNDIFRITFSQLNELPAGWTGKLGRTEIDLGPGNEFTFPLYVTPGLDAPATQHGSFKLGAETDVGGGTGIPGDQVSVEVVVRRVYNLTTPPLPDANVDPGETLRYALPLTNAGNGDVTIELKPGAPTGFVVRNAAPSVPLAVGQTGSLDLEIVVPKNTPPGEAFVNLTLRLSNEADHTILIPLSVAPLARLEFTAPRTLAAAPGRAASIPLTVVNGGNLAGTFAFEGTVPEGWSLRFDPPAVDLAPGASRQVRAIVNASRSAPDGAQDVTLAATFGGAPAGSVGVRTDLSRPALYIDRVESTGELRTGESIVVSAYIGNRGGIAGEDVAVALAIDGVVVDTVRIARVTPGQVQVATLHWLATHGGADVRVILDPDQQIVMSAREGDVASVNFASGLGVPGPGVIATIVALSIVAFATRAREYARTRTREDEKGPRLRVSASSREPSSWRPGGKQR